MLNSADRDDYESVLNSVHSASLLMERSIRNCLGQNCFDEKPSHSPSFEIGMLGLPCSGSVNYYNMTTSLMPVMDNTALVQSTHVPPYGKGKTHGWSRIIRLFVSPIHQALHVMLKSGKVKDGNFLKLFDTQV